MKILIGCTLMIYQLQFVEPMTRHQRQQQLRDRFQFEGPTEHGHEITRLLDRTWTQTNKALLLLDRQTPEQRKRTDTDGREISTSPEEIHVESRSPCSCESQYELRDLGEGHYPRYLTASRCKPKNCRSKFNACKLLHYMVHVLMFRKTAGTLKEWFVDDDSLPKTPLPDSLRHEWQLKPISVSVACVPI